MEDKRKLLDFINLIREKAEKTKLVIFVGAGVSCNVEGMPSWYTLIQKMAEAINYSKCSTCSHKKECTEDCALVKNYSTDDFLKIPQFVYNKSQEMYKRVLLESIMDVVVDAPLSFALFDINPVHIITTNYDRLIESSSNVLCNQYKVIVKDRDLLESDKNKYIVKMHGDIAQPETIVLKEQDYLNYSQNHVLIEIFLKSLFTDHTILFLGYSLNDYNIKLILSWLNFMRIQNEALNNGEEVGYIVLDEEEINEIQSEYFRGNNIGVINIREMPLVKDIHKSLSSERGQRLYSFLKTISDQSLNRSTELFDYSVNIMAKYNFIDHITIMKLLYINQYDKIDTWLYLDYESDYNLLEQYMSNDNENTNQLRQLFVNSGVEEIIFQNSDIEKHIRTDDIRKGSLFSNELFSL